MPSKMLKNHILQACRIPQEKWSNIANPNVPLHLQTVDIYSNTVTYLQVILLSLSFFTIHIIKAKQFSITLRMYSRTSGCHDLSQATSSPQQPVFQNTKRFQVKLLYLEPLTSNHLS